MNRENVALAPTLSNNRFDQAERTYNPSVPFLSNFERLRRAKALAENRDISLRTVSNETGLSFSTLQRVKSETMETVNLATIEVLCRYFKVKKIGDLVEYVPQEGATGQGHPERTSDPKAPYRAGE